MAACRHPPDQHEWFRQALAASPGSPEPERYLFRDGRSEYGELPSNDRPSRFHGAAWTRIINPDGVAGQRYEHLFEPEQPDLNLDIAEVRDDFERTLAFWFDRGVDGFRIDVARSRRLPGAPAMDIDGYAVRLRAGWGRCSTTSSGPSVMRVEVHVHDAEPLVKVRTPKAGAHRNRELIAASVIPPRGRPGDRGPRTPGSARSD